MDAIIFLFLLQDSVVNGAIYALTAFALVLTFTVTRVIFFPQGEFIAFAGLTLIALHAGRVPGTAGLLIAVGAVSAISELFRGRRRLTRSTVLTTLGVDIVYPLALFLVVTKVAPLKLGVYVEGLLTLALVIPLGPAIYRIAFKAVAEASILVLLFVGMGVHLALTGIGLYLFGPDGGKGPALYDATFVIGDLPVSGQGLIIVGATSAIVVAHWLYFGRTRSGKALRASAVNRVGARLVGIPTPFSGQVAFGLAAALGAVSGVLLAPLSTTYYDGGFLIGLKGFVAAILAGLVSYPVAIVAGIAIAVVEGFSSFWASAFKEVIVFTIVLPALLVLSLRSQPVEED